MKSITFALVTALALAAITFSVTKLEFDVQANPAAEPVAAPLGDACQNVKFKFTNQHHSGGKIRFQRIRYYNRANGNWQTEDVNNAECNQGRTCATTGNNLRDSEGEDLTKFRLVYKYLPTGAGANWSDEVESGDLTPTNPVCNANKTYGPGSQGWIIR